jgi:predicted  nucleic acid-binding Zn-ribbon protein
MGSTVAALVLLLFAIFAVFAGGSQSGTILLVILLLLIAMFVFQALVVVTGLRQQPLADANPAWQESYAAPAPPPIARSGRASLQTLTLKCSSCGTVFDVEDTGERPLRHVCPGCGSEGQLSEEDIGPGVGAPAPALEAPRAAAETITLKCGNCGTIFDVTDTGERPLRHVCPGCGSEGVLREEDLGPAPAAKPKAAPRAPARGPAAARPTKTVKTLKLRCKNCGTVFTPRDTGERPLYHECPGCKATGVLR